jgi:hypothetical protein
MLDAGDSIICSALCVSLISDAACVCVRACVCVHNMYVCVCQCECVYTKYTS